MLPASLACADVSCPPTLPAGLAAGLIAKYRPPCPIVVVSTDEQVLRQCGIAYGMLPLKASHDEDGYKISACSRTRGSEEKLQGLGCQRGTAAGFRI